MANQTIIAVPVDVAETAESLQRFLSSLIEQLDIVLGYRGNNAYIGESDIQSSLSLQELNAALIAIGEQLEILRADISATEDSIEVNESAISELNSQLSSTLLSSTYHDFDAADFATLEGNAEVITLGSNLSNTPYTPVGGETYYNYFNAKVTANGGVVHELRAYSTTTLAPTSYFRIGDSWTTAKALGWT